MKRVQSITGVRLAPVVLCAAAVALWMSAGGAKQAQSPQAARAGVSAAGISVQEPRELRIQLGSTDELGADAARATLRGPDASLQLVVTAKDAGGRVYDVTADSAYSVAPAGIVRVSAAGEVLPLADGTATITATGAGIKSTASVTVEKFAHPDPINFANQVVPIFTKAGCNSGGCHGKLSGQNGFRLSLLGFEPQKDYRYLVQESRGRRIFPAAPDQSLLLLKSTNELAHGGGQRIKPGSRDYRIIYRWIAQGTPYGRETDATLTGVSVYPRTRVMARDGRQQLLVIARFSDGTSDDVTSTNGTSKFHN